MPRLRRSWVPGAGAHTICRFIDRRFTLVQDTDRHRVLESIEHAHDRWDWMWLSYAVMSTHLHLIANARCIASVPTEVPLTSKNRAATRARLLVAIVATTTYGQTHADVAAQLGLGPGSVGNLICRGRASSGVEPALAELRRRMALK